MNALIRFSSLALAGLIGLCSASAQAQIGPDPHNKARPARIVGVWDVTVTITRCSDGTPLLSFPAMHKFELGGTGQVVPSTSPAALSAHMLVWNYVDNQDYQTAMKMFRFDPVGNYIGWVTVTSEVHISKEADVYDGSGIAQFYDTSGNLIGSNCPTFTGTRFSGGL